ncbi:MAG: hypothetical protein OXH19_08690 [Chloroflexi bacterium]|nr:hypothetical protein [Chloroflexota bacterium]MCY3588852.1 hypothetical protein [Chloroflexota bacterium]MCY3685717.1 hypothetical protein [Chloroflexota bacterium]MDE2709201.1 hypothetical protein [Chloroflexota bacterium]
MTALGVIVALVTAMFVALAPARAHDLGECSDPEFLTQVACEADAGADGTEGNDDDPTWTAGTHTAGNHPPTLSITVLDSDGIVSDDTTVNVWISVANIHIADPRSGDPLVGAETAFSSDVTLEYLRVSGELEGPATAPTFTATGNGDDDNSAAGALGTIVIPAGTTPGEYTVSTRLTPRTGATAYYDYSGNDFVTKTARATFTVGEAGLGVSAAELSLGNRVNDDPATLTDETKGESGSDSATGDGINLLVSASNSLGNKANNSDVDQITVIAPGGLIAVNSPRKDDATARPQTKTNIITSSLAAETNSFSISETTVTKAAATDDAIQQTMSLNVNKADDQPGTVDVYVIFSGKGAAISNTITLTFTGPNDALGIGEASESLLSFAEVSELPEVLRRDIISFALSATDAGGNPGGVPNVRTRILDVDGKVVNQEKISVEQGPDANAIPNAKLTLTSLNDALTPLKVGTYSIRISSSGGLVANGEFQVVGRADGVDLSVDNTAPSAVGEIVTATATVTSGGEPVPNGTIVTFAASDVAGDGDSVLVAVGGGVVQRTNGGVATASFVAVGSGRSVISATAHRTTDVEVITSTAGGSDVIDDRGPSLADFSRLTGLASYSGPDASASDLLALLAGRASAIWLSSGDGWVLYSSQDGSMVPGSMDFTATAGDVIYISN